MRIHRTSLIAAVFFLTIVCGTARAELPDVVRQDIDACIANRLYVGLVVGIVDKDGARYYAYGTTAIDGGTRPDEHTLFEIGSITKVFTCELLAEMVERGEVNLDDVIDKYLPSEVTAPQRDGHSVTLLSLATQTSGLPRLPDNFAPADTKNPYADYTAERLYEFLSGHRLSGEVGAVYEYSNLGMGLLGHVLSLRAGSDYGPLMRERITGVLEMSSTAVTLNSELQERLAAGHSGVIPVPNWDMGALQGAGGLRSSAHDMIAFLEANSGLRETPLQEVMLSTHRPRHATATRGTEIGLGWQITETPSGDVVWHNGGTGGYRSFAGFIAGKRGVVVLSNTDVGADNIGLYLLDPNREYRHSPEVATVDAAILRRYVGQYELLEGVLFDIRIVSGALTAQLPGQPRATLFPTTETEFFYTAVDARMQFKTDASGHATELVLTQGGRNQTAKKLADDYKLPEHSEIEIDPQILKDYVGHYELAPGVVFDVTTRDGSLMIKLSGQPSIPVYPEAKDKFFYKVVYAQITFVRDDSGAVTALVLHQNGVDQRARRI